MFVIMTIDTTSIQAYKPEERSIIVLNKPKKLLWEEERKRLKKKKNF
jgi:hypothetical protein